MAGPNFFAWVDASESTFDAVAYAREDEVVLSYTVEQTEGNFATLTLNVKNPRVGFLAPGRKQWAWLSTKTEAGVVTPLFFGRLIAIPQNLQAETLTLKFVAKPSDYQSQKAGLASELRFLPWFDPLFVDPSDRANADAVLEARSALWHIDRITHEVTVSDILNGEDGVKNYGEDKVFYDSLGLTFGDAPARAVQVNATVGWSQSAAGLLDLTDAITKAVRAVSGGTFGVTTSSMKGGLIASYTGTGLAKSWPKPGTGINGGWSINNSGVNLNNPDIPTVLLQGVRTPGIDPATIFGPPGSLWLPLRYPNDPNQSLGTAHPSDADAPAIIMPLVWFRQATLAGYEASRQRTEGISFTLEADVQSVMSEQSDDEIVTINIQGARADEIMELVRDSESESGVPGEGSPIEDVRRRSFFTSPRGQKSIQYLALLARAALLSRSRTVRTTFQIPFEDGLDLSCRKSVALTDRRLPGGAATGKIVGYQITQENGKKYCTVTIASAIGHGGVPTEVQGDPTYVEDGYVEDGYQTRAGQMLIMPSTDVAIGDVSNTAPNDDGVDFINGINADTMIQSLSVQNGLAAQAQALRNVAAVDAPSFIEQLNAMPTKIFLLMVPVTGGPFNTDYAPVMGPLKVPKMIDLEAGEE